MSHSVLNSREQLFYHNTWYIALAGWKSDARNRSIILYVLTAHAVIDICRDHAIALCYIELGGCTCVIHACACLKHTCMPHILKMLQVVIHVCCCAHKTSLAFPWRLLRSTVMTFHIICKLKGQYWTTRLAIGTRLHRQTDLSLSSMWIIFTIILTVYS